MITLREAAAKQSLSGGTKNAIAELPLSNNQQIDVNVIKLRPYVIHVVI